MPQEDRPGQDTEDCSDLALDEALGGCLAGSDEECTLFYKRLARRCVGKVEAHMAARFPDLSPHDREMTVQEVLNDVVLKSSLGSISIKEGYTRYLSIACEHRVAERYRGKKGKEAVFSQIDRKVRPNPGRPTETLLLETIAAPSRRPQGVAIEREFLRRVGEQVGALPPKMRDVVVRSREGLDYVDIARELGSTYETVKAQFSQAVVKLREAIKSDGILKPAKLLLQWIETFKPAEEKDGLLGLVQALPVGVRTPLEEIHFSARSVSEVAEGMNERRAGVEALLLYGYMVIGRVTGREFPKAFLEELPRRSRYHRHQVGFRFW